MNAAASPMRACDKPLHWSDQFIPEHLTPLFFTPVYRELSGEQRLRYNQLHALYFHEQIIFFEAKIGCPVLEALLREFWPQDVSAGLREFLEEERQHTEMFRQLIRRCAPDWYEGCAFRFIDVPRAWAALLRSATRRPLLFPLWIWLMLLQEERSLYYSKEFIRQSRAIEPHFVEAHRAHLADEIGHVRWDEELLDVLWPRTSPAVRRVNAAVFGWMLREFFHTPKRAQLRVVEELACQLPELRGQLPQMRRQLLALAGDAEYQSSLYSRTIVPRVFARFDRLPEFRSLGETIRGYRPPKEATP